MEYRFPHLADCKTRADMDRHGETILETARAIVDGGPEEARRYARQFYDFFGQSLEHYRDASPRERAQAIASKAEDALIGAKAALAFGPTRVLTNDHGHRLVCVPHLYSDSGKFHGYIPWVEESRAR